MPGRPKSNAKKRQEFNQRKDKWMDCAVKMYCHLNGEAITSEPEDRNETEMEEEEGPSGKSLRAVCKHMEEKCWKEDKMLIKLDKTTLKRDLAKAQRQRIGWPKPKMGKLEGMISSTEIGGDRRK